MGMSFLACSGPSRNLVRSAHKVTGLDLVKEHIHPLILDIERIVQFSDLCTSFRGRTYAYLIDFIN